MKESYYRIRFEIRYE